MAFSYSQRTGAILGFSLTVFAAGSLDARAQETAAGSATGGACPNDGVAAFADPLSKPHWNGWGVDPSQHRFQPADMAGLAPSDVTRLKLKWAFGLPGTTFAVAQPTIFGGRVFVGSQNGKVYSLDAKSGCYVLGVSTQASPCGRPSSSVRAGTAGRPISATPARTSRQSTR